MKYCVTYSLLDAFLEFFDQCSVLGNLLKQHFCGIQDFLKSVGCFKNLHDIKKVTSHAVYSFVSKTFNLFGITTLSQLKCAC